MDYNWTVKIADFGMSQIKVAGEGAGGVVGSPFYMAPGKLESHAQTHVRTHRHIHTQTHSDVRTFTNSGVANQGGVRASRWCGE